MGGRDVEHDEDGFRPMGLVPEAVHQEDRAGARSGYRVFVGTGGFETAIPEQIIQRMLTWGRAAAPLEWLGLVVGRVCQDARGRHVVVVGIVPDPEARAERHFVETTVASEHATRSSARALFPDGVVVGWVHGHVRHGARYSSRDLKNQATWTQPHALGIVVDPWDPAELAVYRGPASELLRARTASKEGDKSFENVGIVTFRSAPVVRTETPVAPKAVAPAAVFAPAPRARRRQKVRVAAAVLLVLGLVACVGWYGHTEAQRMRSVEIRLARVEQRPLVRGFTLRPVGGNTTAGETSLPTVACGPESPTVEAAGQRAGECCSWQRLGR